LAASVLWGLTESRTASGGRLAAARRAVLELRSTKGLSVTSLCEGLSSENDRRTICIDNDVLRHH
jgi:hypothetical protein